MADVRINELMTDEDFIQTIEEMHINEDSELGDLLKAMNENRIISWEEAERILQDSSNAPVKSSLPEQTRPTEPDNDTDVEKCIQRLLDNDPTLKEINLNNMKRTPVPQIRRLLEALAYNEYCERISLANMGLYDHDVQVLITVIEMNQAIKKLNLETNYLSGDYFAKLFKAALVNMTIEEIKAVNQGVSFSTSAEKEIIESVMENKGLIKVSVNLRLPEGRHKIEKATLRNGEIRRMIRREAALKAKQDSEAGKKEEETKPPMSKPVKEPLYSSVKVPPPPPKTEPAGNPLIDLPKPKPLKSVWPPPAPPADEEDNQPMEPFKKGKPLHPLARRQSNADDSSTPVLKFGSEAAPIRKLAQELRKNPIQNGEPELNSVKKLSGATTATVTERASREFEKDVEDVEEKKLESTVQKGTIAMAWRRPSSIVNKPTEEDNKSRPVLKQFIPVKKSEPVAEKKDDKPKPTYLVRREAREVAEKQAQEAEAAWKAAEEELRRKIAEAEALMKAAQEARLAAEAAKPPPLSFLTKSPEPPKEDKKPIKPTRTWTRPDVQPQAIEEKSASSWRRQPPPVPVKTVSSWRRLTENGLPEKSAPSVSPKKSDYFSVNGVKTPLSPLENGNEESNGEPKKKTIIKKKVIRKKRPSERSDGNNSATLEESTLA